MTDYEARARIAELEAKLLRIEGRLSESKPSDDDIAVALDRAEAARYSEQCWLYLVKDKADHGRIFYVGISKKPDMRMTQHMSDGQSAVWHYVKERGGAEYAKNIDFVFLPAFACWKAARIAEKMLIATLPGLVNRDVQQVLSWYNAQADDGREHKFRERSDNSRKTAPWKVLGISRATYFRRMKSND